MSVSLRVGPIAYPIERADFLGSFFDTVTVRLEGGARGSRFPTLTALYRDGELSPDAAQLARAELANVELELRQYPPTDVVWDIDDPALALPWGSDIADAKLLNRHKETAPYRAVTQPGSTPASAGIAPARGLA